MENITIGEIVSAIGIITVIATFVCTIVHSIKKWYKSRITDKFEAIDTRMDNFEEHIKIIESKKEEYEREVLNSRHERKILLKGELSALKGLYEITKNDLVAEAIKEIEEYMMEKSHDSDI